jgi:hypothetical protein
MTINKGCRVLFIAQLSVFPNEYEILIPPYHTCTYLKSETKDDRLKTSNNIMKEFDLFINQEFKSYDIIISSTPNNKADYLRLKKEEEEAASHKPTSRITPTIRSKLIQYSRSNKTE